ncbi:uncharacterized protein [Watersipora subatra]|uniref:uncharacterized protein isoform X3 n=1 Tax=Watersipora subatra TaxID=2589382 RepID=UPI00355B1351
MLNKNDQMTKMLCADPKASSDTYLKRRGKTITRQERHRKWRQDYMVTSMPSQVDEVVKPMSLKRTDFHSFTQSLHRHTSEEIKREMRKKRLLKLLRDCAESVESIACKSYVESMRSCGSSDSSMYASDLIILDDSDAVPQASLHSTTNRSIDAKNLSEIVLRDNSDAFPHTGSGEVLYASTDNLVSNRYGTGKLRLSNSLCSSYVDESDLSHSPIDVENLGCKLNQRRWPSSAIQHTRADECSKFIEYDYHDLVTNGKTTAFLSQNEEELSLCYDDEFDIGNSPLGAQMHDSGLEAAICHQYASLLRNNDFTHSNDAHSNFSSDFDSIFPASLSLLHAESSSDERPMGEEISELDTSVPNYANIPASTKKDYQLTFTQAESLYSDARSTSVYGASFLDSEYEEAEADSTECLEPVKLSSERNQIPKPPRVSRELLKRYSHGDVSPKKVSFSDDLAVVERNERNHQQRMEEIENSTTWMQMKQNYTTWGQIRNDKAERKKSSSVGDMREQAKALACEEVDPKRHSLTLWEMYKRAHSMSLNQSELTTPEAFTESAVDEDKKETEHLAKNINDLLDDALNETNSKANRQVCNAKFDLPDLPFLRIDKENMDKHKWWKEIFEQPSFCTPGVSSRTSSVRTCSHCQRRHSTDQQVILFQGSKPAQYKMCELSMLEPLVISPSALPCKCTHEKLCDLSSGIATGSSGVTPREPSSWQHIADFLKKRQKNTGSRGSFNSTLSDQQLLDIVACVEAADSLIKHQQTASEPGANQEMLLQIWKLVSALECVLSMGLKSHKLVTVAMGKIRTRVNIWDIVEESAASAGKLTGNFSQIISEVSKYQLNDTSIKFCLFIVGLMNFQCLDFWLSILTHNPQLMDKYYNEDSYLRSKVVADRKLYTEMIQALQELSLFTWDVDYKNMITACAQPPKAPEKGPEEMPSRNVLYRQSTTSANQLKTAHNYNTQRYYSANNVRQAVLI